MKSPDYQPVLSPHITPCGQFESRIVVPASTLYATMPLEKIHHGHQGIQRRRMRASSSVCWPGVSTAVERFV